MIQGLVLQVVLLSAIASGTPGERGWLGMMTGVREGPNSTRFVYVARVSDRSPAGAGGVRDGDIVTGIDGRPVRFRDDLDLLSFIAGLKPGQRPRLTVVRQGRIRQLTIVVGSRPRNLDRAWEEMWRRASESRRKNVPPR